MSADPRRVASPSGTGGTATGVELIAAERHRQIDVEGWTAEHDDEHMEGELSGAASSYAAVASKQIGSFGMEEAYAEQTPTQTWRWSSEWWKPSADPLRNLVKAGALIAAEIDRLQRVFNEIPHGLSLEEEAEGRAALAALLAVGERDKAEIARLTEERDAAVREAGIWQRDRNVQASAGERDRRQIAQLTEALAFYADADNYFETYLDETQVSVQCPAFDDEGSRARAVLADEEDAP